MCDAGGRAYYVGGCVRDTILHRDSKDIDLEIYGTLIERKMTYPEQKMIDREEHLDTFIQDELQQIGRLAAALPDEQERKWDILNQFFLSELNSF